MIFVDFWTHFIYQPLYNLLVFIYHFTPGPNLGWAVVTIAVLIRLLFLYFSIRGYKTDAILDALAPQIKAIENDATLTSRQQRAEVSRILKGKNIDPLAEIWALLAQLIYMIAQYQVLQNGFKVSGEKLIYSFNYHPTSFNTIFFGIDLSKTNFLLSFIAAAVLCFELIWEYNSKKDIPRATVSEKWFPIFLPIFTFILLIILPSAKAIFILTTVIFSLILRLIMTLAFASKK